MERRGKERKGTEGTGGEGKGEARKGTEGTGGERKGEARNTLLVIISNY